ncbi:MAG: carbonate dehydratase [Alphaproteobacteria bacterium]|nr:MAG: carbonate dehydratase [Alphaproteobacteria bacterium]
MTDLKKLLDNNKNWAARIQREDPTFFQKLVEQQSPEYLWIGCSDSRVPANQIVGLVPGEVFVHRNVANLVVQTDLNCLSVVQYAVEVLKVRHIIVCGHYGCGGVRAALEKQKLGLIDGWLANLQKIAEQHAKELKSSDAQQNWDRLCELNVIEQVWHVTQTSIVQNAWKAGQDLTVHGWIYSVKNGLLKDLNVASDSQTEAERKHQSAIRTLSAA